MLFEQDRDMSSYMVTLLGESVYKTAPRRIATWLFVGRGPQQIATFNNNIIKKSIL